MRDYTVGSAGHFELRVADVQATETEPDTLLPTVLAVFLSDPVPNDPICGESSRPTSFLELRKTAIW